MKAQMQWISLFSLMVLPHVAMSDESFYCSQHMKYINMGMSEAEVVDACGPPLSKSKSDTPPTQKVPVQQLIYTTLNQGAVYSTLNPIYTQWSLPSGSTGSSLHINIIDGKVSSMSMDGSSTNALSVCKGGAFEIGAPVSKVYIACGNPSMTNNTYINEPIPGRNTSETWVYQIDRYQPSMSMTFVNGRLQSINR